ncbi:MAG: tetratricopeptide repeat protein [Cryomorphaceae bacterium]
MKFSNLKALALVAITGLLITACGGLGKMAKYAETVEYNLDPNPLIVRGDSVAVNINGKFPGKYFSKKAMVEITPTLTYSGGSTPYEMVSFQGEDAAGNATVIPFENGKSFTYSDKVAYQPSMKNSELMLNILGKQGNKEKAFEPYKLADGVITTPFMLMSDDKPIIAKDQFQRVTSHDAYAVINYLVNRSNVRSSELRDDDIKAIDSFLKEYGTHEDYDFKGAEIVAYASPEGELSLNEDLAKDRAESASKAVSSLMKKHKMEFDADAFFNLMPKGEDWEGFKEKMQASDIDDKELILRILEMYSDNSKREEEIRNLAATYTELKEKILPELRRSQITVNYDIVGRSDEEIISIARSANADTLSLEEMLYAATLTEDMNEQNAIYEKASQVYPDDYRAFNNMGVISLQKNNLSAAQEMFENPISTNNLAIIERLNGNRAEAMSMLNDAAGAGDEVNYNMGIIDIQNGDYDSAIQNMKGYNTFNKALAQVLNGSNEAALSTLDSAPEKDTAEGNYLKAIIGARMNDSGMVENSIKAAISMDASLKEKAMDDLEFRNFKDAVN